MTVITNHNQPITKSNDKWLTWLFGALVVLNYIPIISLRLGPYLHMFITISCYIIALFSSRMVLRRISWLLVTVVLFILLTALSTKYLFDMGNKELILWFYSYLCFFQPLFIVSFLLFIGKYRLLATITIIALGALTITSVTTLMGLNVFPDAARILATGDTGVGHVYLSYNIGGYEFVYSLILALPLYNYLFHYRLLNRWILLFVLLLSVIVILKTQYGMATLLMLFAFILFFVNKVNMRKVFIILTTLLLCFILFMPMLPGLMLNFAAHVNTQGLKDRFISLADYLQYGSTESEEFNSRQSDYQLSIASFLDSPILGNLGRFRDERSTGGGHSTFLDIIATSGLLGGLLIFIVFRFYYKNILSPLQGHPAFGYMIWSCILFLLLSIMNISFSLGMVTFLVVPGIAFIRTREARQ